MANGNPKKPKTPSEDVYERNTRRAEIAGWLIVVGLGVELVSLIFAGRPLSELIPQAIADLLIAGGVAFELLFARIARIAGDTAQAEANARAAAAELETERLRKGVWAREIDEPIFLAELAGKPCPLVAIIFRIKGIGGDSWYVSMQIETLLRKAGWNVSLTGRWPLDLSDPRFEPGPTVGRDGPSAGIKLRAPFVASDAESEQTKALMDALAKTLGGVGSAQQQDVKPGTLEVIIFPRP